MKLLLFTVASTSAMLACASPLAQRAVETEWVVRVVTVSVTNSEHAVEPSAAVFVTMPAKTVVVTLAHKPTETAQPPPNQSGPAPETTSSADSSYEGVLLGSHKAHRANHSVEALEWDDVLAQYAHNIASSCVFEHDMNQGDGGYGQNLASWGTSGDLGNSTSAVAKATTDWYNEVANFNYYGVSDPPPSAFESIGHFTQMVWKSSKKVGCATVQCPAGTVLTYKSWYTVCNYQPAGNFEGEYAANVLPPVGRMARNVRLR